MRSDETAVDGAGSAGPPSGAVIATARALATDPRGERFPLWASCNGGCEPEVAAELAALGWGPLDVDLRADIPQGRHRDLAWERGSIYGEADLATLYRTLWAARTPNRVALILDVTAAEELDDVRAAVAELDLTLLPNAAFAVRARRQGDQDFRSPEIAGVAGAAVIDAYRRATGRRLPVDLDDPVSEVLVELSGTRLRVGLALAHHSLHRRGYYTFRHHAALNPNVAAVLLTMAGWEAEESLLDPMCGGGTIPIEAALAAARRPPRSGPLPRVEALGLHDAQVAASVESALARAVRGSAGPGRIAGRDRSGRSIRGARANATAAGVTAVVDLDLGEATDLDGVPPVDCAVMNPPYGIRLGRPRDMFPLYRATFAAVGEQLHPGGRLVVLTAATRAATSAAADAGLTLVARRSLSLGSIDAFAHRLERPRDPGER